MEKQKVGFCYDGGDHAFLGLVLCAFAVIFIFFSRMNGKGDGWLIFFSIVITLLVNWGIYFSSMALYLAPTKEVLYRRVLVGISALALEVVLFTLLTLKGVR